MSKIDTDQQKFFTISRDGKDRLSLLIPHEHLKTLHHSLSILLGRDMDTENPKIIGHYITCTGTLK